MNFRNSIEEKIRFCEITLSKPYKQTLKSEVAVFKGQLKHAIKAENAKLLEQVLDACIHLYLGRSSQEKAGSEEASC